MELLPKEIRDKLPPLGSQDGKGAEQVALVHFFTPGSCWDWWATEGSSIKDKGGQEIDYHFFGLVRGFEVEYGTFSLSELESVGSAIERDLYWDPKTLARIEAELKERG